jgi:predicted glycogen debranching enzyme
MRQPIQIAGTKCQDLGASRHLEWLETNGRGGFAMGTVAGLNTRRYHGLLTAALRPPVQRCLLVSRVEEEFGGVATGVAEYPGAVAPAGFRAIERFALVPFPEWSFSNGLEKQFLLMPHRDAAVLRYRAPVSGTLRIRPFFAFRDYHSLAQENALWDRTVRDTGRGIALRPYPDLPELEVRFAGTFQPDGHWYLRHEYSVERDRGLDFREDLYTPGVVELDLQPGLWSEVVFTLEPGPVDAAAEVSRRRADARSWLELAADQFLVRRADGSLTVIAGYPWFTDWGRDTMISLPGLLIARGRLAEAREILEGFLAHCKRGILPNQFPDGGETPGYNTADATLWMFEAVAEWLRAGGDAAFLREVFYPMAKDILAWHWRGTWHGIQADPADHLLAAGEPGVALTWMDAKVGGWVVTPRHGKAVEINALWYNALCLMRDWAAELGDPATADLLARECEITAQSFRRVFWNEARRYLNDVAGDASLRPNQLFAISLTHSPLDAEQQQAVVLACQRDLLTPFGLRTLAPWDPAFRPRYAGSPAERDGAYHQGSVWPWLFGPYASACLRAFGRAPRAAEHLLDIVSGWEEQIREGGLGTIGEVFDGAPPYRQGGCPAQAWSVAELLRLKKELGLSA